MSRHRPLTRRSVHDGIAKASAPEYAKSVTFSTSSPPPDQPAIDSDLPKVRTTTEVPFWLQAKRPSIVRMRDLTPESRAKVIEEYYQSYDVMTGLRIAATLGGLITLFTLFLLYKSKCKSYKEADLSPSNEDTSPPGSFQVIALGTGESVTTNQQHPQLGLTYQESYYLPNQEEPRGKRHRHHKNTAVAPVTYVQESVVNPYAGSASSSGRWVTHNASLGSPSSSSNSVSSANVTSAEVNVISESRHRTPSFSKCSPPYQTSVESENPEPSTSSYQGSAGSDWAKEIVISKRHLWVQYRPNGDSSDGAKSEDV